MYRERFRVARKADVQRLILDAFPDYTTAVGSDVCVEQVGHSVLVTIRETCAEREPLAAVVDAARARYELERFHQHHPEAVAVGLSGNYLALVELRNSDHAHRFYSDLPVEGFSVAEFKKDSRGNLAFSTFQGGKVVAEFADREAAADELRARAY